MIKKKGESTAKVVAEDQKYDYNTPVEHKYVKHYLLEKAEINL